MNKQLKCKQCGGIHDQMHVIRKDSVRDAVIAPYAVHFDGDTHDLFKCLIFVAGPYIGYCARCVSKKNTHGLNGSPGLVIRD